MAVITAICKIKRCNYANLVADKNVFESAKNLPKLQKSSRKRKKVTEKWS
jgi:hypothetical protein